MDKPALYAPWRMDYLRTLHKPQPDECFLCQASAATSPEEIRDRFVLWKSDLSIVVINRYPYTNGHLLISPRAHKADIEELTIEEQTDIARQLTRAVRLLKRAVGAQGFNVGINIGRCSGAGVPGHLHQHLVPRWAGDINFMATVGEVRVIPEAMSQLYAELMRVSATLDQPDRSS